ncbi:unnamed protein product [Ilex paraguariensis]|uniref:Uncharacterized protein n=1 Tax=Ilex paraguariensis TaxID=185542 RepID=A0ABC8U770_9AQUA
MPFLVTFGNTVAKPTFFFPTVLIYLLLIFSNYWTFTSAQTETTGIGAIIDDSSRIGKEVKTAMKVAAQNFNSSSVYHKVSLHFHNPEGNPIRALYAGATRRLGSLLPS